MSLRAVLTDVSLHNEKNYGFIAIVMDYGLFPLVLPLCVLLLIRVMPDTLGMPILSRKSVVSISSSVSNLIFLV